MLSKESVSVVIPAYNEEATVESVVQEAIQELKKITRNYELVLVNDGSTDKTGEIINRMARSNKHIRVVHHKINRGFTGAMKTSFKSAKKNLIFLAPADGQFDFNQLKNFVEAIRGFDAATAYRAEDDITFAERVKSNFFHLPFLFVCRYLLGIKLREFSTVSLWRRRVVDSIVIESDDRSAMFLPEIISKALKKRYKFTEVPIYWHRRKGGEAKGTNPLVALRTLRDMIKLWYQLHWQKS